MDRSLFNRNRGRRAPQPGGRRGIHDIRRSPRLCALGAGRPFGPAGPGHGGLKVWRNRSHPPYCPPGRTDDDTSEPPGCSPSPALLTIASSADARVVRLVVEKTTPFDGGRSIGASRPVRTAGRTGVFRSGPEGSAEQGHRQSRQGAEERQGMVEFSAPFFIVKPKDIARGNQKIFYGMNNRGNNIEFGHATWPARPAGRGDRVRRHPRASPRLRVRRCRLGRRRRDHREPAWREPAGRGRSRTGAQSSRRFASSTATPTGYTMPLKGNDRFRSYETADIEHGERDVDGPRLGATAHGRRSRRTGGRSASVRRARRRSSRRRSISASSTSSRRTGSTS